MTKSSAIFIVINGLYLLFSNTLFAQEAKAILKQAESHFIKGEYASALDCYILYEKKKNLKTDELLGAAICHFELNHIDEAETRLKEAAQKKDGPPADTWRYLAKIRHERFQFEQAIVFYKKFLRAAESGHPLRAAVKDAILRCGNGTRIRRQAAEGAVVNLDTPLNGTGDDFKPLLTSREPDRLFFAKKKIGSEGLPSSSDIYFSDLDMGDWAMPSPIGGFINSIDHEVPQSFDEKGQQFYFFRGKTLFSGDLIFDSLQMEGINALSFPQLFESPVRGWKGDRDLFFFNDSILLFASRRPGGHGGLDLYVATLRADGWSAAENLGPVINSAYDETSPFLARDGRTLYFSTNDARRSMGGLDIMRSVFLDRPRLWIPAENLGPGFNSAGDDEHFLLTDDGSRAFFSSSRKQGMGMRDLYVGIFEEKKSEQLRPSQPVAFHFVEPHPPIETLPPLAPEVPNGSTVLLTPLPYLKPNDPLAETGQTKLDELIGWLVKYPELKITFVAHTASGDGREAGMAALRMAEEKCRASGIDLENIVLRNAHAAFGFSDKKAPENRRVAIVLANPEILPVRVERPEIRGSRASFFQKAMNRLVFQVKIPIDEGGFAESCFRQYPDGNLTEHPASGKSDFLHGIYLTWDAAWQAQNEARRNGFPRAIATPYLRGWELSRADAEGLLHIYPSLAAFVNP